jgi:hypothetical protein
MGWLGPVAPALKEKELSPVFWVPEAMSPKFTVASITLTSGSAVLSVPVTPAASHQSFHSASCMVEVAPAAGLP